MAKGGSMGICVAAVAGKGVSEEEQLEEVMRAKVEAWLLQKRGEGSPVKDETKKSSRIQKGNIVVIKKRDCRHLR